MISFMKKYYLQLQGLHKVFFLTIFAVVPAIFLPKASDTLVGFALILFPIIF
tara:strand:- start:822 stop:977 length:156 start_codon:yes stop_codon:yes gene_type:complete